MPKAYGYIRVSHEDQAEDGNSLETQRRAVHRRFEDMKEADPTLEFGGFYADPAVSAFKKPFLKRPGAVQLHGLLRKGDVVIFSRVDRAFRNLQDLLHMMDVWDQKGVAYYFCDYTLDSRTSMGRMFLMMLGMIAEIDSHQKSERIKAGLRTKKAQGLAYTSHLRGFKKKYSATLKSDVFIPDHEIEELGALIDKLHKGGLGYRLISDELEDIMATKQGRKSYRGIRSRYQYKFDRCNEIHRWWKEMQAEKLVVGKDAN